MNNEQWIKAIRGFRKNLMIEVKKGNIRNARGINAAFKGYFPEIDKK